MSIPLNRGCIIKQLNEIIQVCNFLKKWNWVFDGHSETVLAKVNSLLELLSLTVQEQKQVYEVLI